MAKYYRRKQRDLSTYARKTSLCWDCKNCYGGCCWSQSFEPVPGWDAVKTNIPSNGEFAESYKVINCPEFIRD